MKKLTYKKLFKLMIDYDINTTQLIEETNLSRSTFYKLKKGENITTDVILRICDVFDCDISDIVEIETVGE